MSIKTGTIIHDVKDEPLLVEPLLKRTTRRYKEMFQKLMYANEGKPYISSGKTKHATNRNGFYILELPVSYRTKDNKPIQSSKEHIGYKLGMTASMGGLISRFGTYYVEVGSNVKILHIRIFNNENLSYFGSRERAKEYELAIKQELNRKKVRPARGSSNSEYYKTLQPILDAMKYIDANPRLIGDIDKEVEIEKVKNELATNDRLVMLMNVNNKLKPFALTLKTYVKKNGKWKVKFDDDDKQNWEFKFPPSLEGVNQSSGWVREEDAKGKFKIRAR